jgi:hypothetical protein
LSFSWNPSYKCLNRALQQVTRISFYAIRNHPFEGHATPAVDVSFFQEENYYVVSFRV